MVLAIRILITAPASYASRRPNDTHAHHRRDRCRRYSGVAFIGLGCASDFGPHQRQACPKVLQAERLGESSGPMAAAVRTTAGWQSGSQDGVYLGSTGLSRCPKTAPTGVIVSVAVWNSQDRQHRPRSRFIRPRIATKRRTTPTHGLCENEGLGTDRAGGLAFSEDVRACIHEYVASGRFDFRTLRAYIRGIVHGLSTLDDAIPGLSVRH